MTPEARYAGFFFPVIDGMLYVSQRMKAPHQGLYGPVGGKGVHERPAHRWNMPYLIEKMGGARVASIADQVAESQGREGPLAMAIRETCEELFSDLRFPDDFPESALSHIARLGVVTDYNPETPNVDYHNTLFIGTFTGLPFSPKQDEVGSVKRIEKVAPDQLFPMAQLGIEQLRFCLDAFDTVAPYSHYKSLLPFLPRFDTLPKMNTDMMSYFARPEFSADDIP